MCIVGHPIGDSTFRRDPNLLCTAGGAVPQLLTPCFSEAGIYQIALFFFLVRQSFCRPSLHLMETLDQDLLTAEEAFG